MKSVIVKLQDDIIERHRITAVEPDHETHEGMVGRIDRDTVPRATAELHAAGYGVSTSRDDDGVTWIWWAPVEARNFSNYVLE